MTTLTDYTELLPAASAEQPNFVAMLSALLDGFVDVQNCMLGMPGAFDIDAAVGKQLDDVGERVGLSRKVPVPIEGVYFALDGNVSTILNGDGVTASVSLPAGLDLGQTDFYREDWQGRIKLSSTPRTNVFQNNIYPPVSSVSAGDGAIAAPDGTICRAYVPTTTNTIHMISPGGSVSLAGLAAGESRVFALSGYFAKYGPKEYKVYFTLNASDGTPAYALILFNPTTGAFLSKTLQSGWAEVAPPSAVLVGGMWRATWTVRFTQTTPAKTTLSSAFQIWNEANAQNYAGDGVSGVYAWLPQLEESATATSPIESTLSFTSRASVGRYFNAAGVLTEAAANVARINYNPANLAAPGKLLIEDVRTNLIPNNSAQGGGAAALPTGWAISGHGTTSNGITRTINGVGVEDGIDYIDVTFSGTSTVNTWIAITPHTNTVAGVAGEVFTVSAFMRLLAGSWAGIVTGGLEGLRITERDASNAILTYHGSTVAANGGPLSTQRFTRTATLSGATTTNVVGAFQISVPAGNTINMTLRFGMPQLELGAFASSPIRTTNAAVTRAADISTSTATTITDFTAVAGTLTIAPVPPVGTKITTLDTRPGVGLDEGVLRGPFDPAEALASLDDGTYRLVLKIKVRANGWNGSLEQAQQMLAALQSDGAYLFMQDRFDMTAAIGVSGKVPSKLFVSLLKQIKGWVTPAAVDVSDVYATSRSGSPIFGLDIHNNFIAGLDTGAVAVTY